jgi:hypothetical protein
MRVSHLPIWTPLATSLLGMAWLLPNASPPWVAFHKDALVALVALLVTSALIARQVHRHRSWRVDAVSGLLLVLACATMLQWVFGQIHFFGHAAVGAVYLSGAALAILIGRAWEEDSPDHVGEFLYPAFLIGAVCTVGLMLTQWLRLDISDVWINYLRPGGRPFGNLVQSNNAATLLLLGLLGLKWLAFRGRIRKPVLLIAGGFLLFGLALSGSRIGYLSFVVIACAGIGLGFRHGEMKDWRNSIIALLVIFVFSILLLNLDLGVVSFKSGDIRPAAFDRELTGVRMIVYKAYIHAIAGSPWVGYGFEQGAKTQIAAAMLGFEIPGLFTWSHSLVLDLMAWYGIPIAVVVGAVAVFTIWHLFRMSGFRLNYFVHIASLIVVLMHAMVELPLAYGYFLLPVCLLLGAVLSKAQMPSIQIGWPPVVAFFLCICISFAFIVVDYFRVESAYYAWRFKQARIGNYHPMEIPDVFLLNQFRAHLVGLRGSSDTLSPKQLTDYEQSVFLNPSPVAMVHLTELHLKGGDVARAQHTADWSRLLGAPMVRESMAAEWARRGRLDPIYHKVVWRE